MKSVINFLKKFRLGWWKQFRENMENYRENRQLIGEDRSGNKYYQYYSHYGLPTRREVRFKTLQNMQLNDLVYYQWIYNHAFDPPTQTQKQQFYLQEKLRKERALQWDQKEQKMMLEFRKKREELLLRDQALLELQREMEETKELTDIKTKRKT